RAARARPRSNENSLPVAGGCSATGITSSVIDVQTNGSLPAMCPLSADPPPGLSNRSSSAAGAAFGDLGRVELGGTGPRQQARLAGTDTLGGGDHVGQALGGYGDG